VCLPSLLNFLLSCFILLFLLISLFFLWSLLPFFLSFPISYAVDMLFLGVFNKEVEYSSLAGELETGNLSLAEAHARLLELCVQPGNVKVSLIVCPTQGMHTCTHFLAQSLSLRPSSPSYTYTYTHMYMYTRDLQRRTGKLVVEFWTIVVRA
jgi:hypothetical protein